MRSTDFQPESPGKLVATSFSENLGGKAMARAGLAFVPADLPPRLDRIALTGRLYQKLEAATIKLARLDSILGHLPSPTVLLSALRAREAQASSRIENTFATLDQVALAGLAPKGGDTQESEVGRNVAMIEAGLAASWPIGRALIREMHKVLIEDPKLRPGEFRVSQVCIGDRSRGFEHARFVPPPPTHLNECLEAWEHFANLRGDGASWPTLLRLGLEHYQFETIHPFDDGNGRLGRALVTIAPVKEGYLTHPVCNISEWVHDHRDEYYDGLLRVSTHGDWDRWLSYFCSALAEQAQSDLARAQRLIGLMGKYRKGLIGKRRSTLPQQLIDFVFIYQVMTIPWAAKLLKVTYASARQHVDALVRQGVLEEPFDHLRLGKVFMPREIIDAIRGPGGWDG